MGIFDTNGKLKVSGLVGGSSSGGGITVVTSMPASPTAGQMVSLNGVVYWYSGTDWNILEEDIPNPFSAMGSDLALWLDWKDLARGTVSSWVDKTVNANNAAQGTSGNRPLIAKFGVRFDGTDDYMTITDHATLDATTNLTVGYCINSDDISGNKVPICKSSTGAGSWSVQSNAAKVRFHCGAPGSNFAETTNDISVADVSIGFIWVYDGSLATNADRLKLYVNGVQVDLSFTGTIPSALTATSDNITIGAYSNPAQYYKGAIHAIALSLTSLTQAQVTDLNAYFEKSKSSPPVETFRPAGIYSTQTTAFYRSANGVAPGANDFIAVAIISPTINRDATGVMPIMSNKNFATPAGWTIGWNYGPLVLDVYGSGGTCEASVATTAFNFDMNKGRMLAIGVRVRLETTTTVGEIWIGTGIAGSASMIIGGTTVASGTPLDLLGGSFFGDEKGSAVYLLGMGYYEGRISEMEMTQLMGYCQKYGTIPTSAVNWGQLYLGEDMKFLPATLTNRGQTASSDLTKNGTPTAIDSFLL